MCVTPLETDWLKGRPSVRFIKWDKLQISGAHGPRYKDRRIRCELVSGQHLPQISLSTYLSLSLPFFPSQLKQIKVKGDWCKKHIWRGMKCAHCARREFRADWDYGQRAWDESLMMQQQNWKSSLSPQWIYQLKSRNPQHKSIHLWSTAPFAFELNWRATEATKPLRCHPGRA